MLQGTPRNAAHHLSLFFLLSRSLPLRFFSLLPAGIGIVFLHGFGDNAGLFSEILLIHHAIAADNERHHAGRPVLCWISHESDSFGHLAVHDVALRAARAILPLKRQNLEVIAVVRSR